MQTFHQFVIIGNENVPAKGETTRGLCFVELGLSRGKISRFSCQGGVGGVKIRNCVKIGIKPSKNFKVDDVWLWGNCWLKHKVTTEAQTRIVELTKALTGDMSDNDLMWECETQIDVITTFS